MSNSIEFIYRHFQNNGGLFCTDSRKIISNSIFFALKGENFNGNIYAEKALEEGCSLAVIDDNNFLNSDKMILVNDVLKALQDLSNLHRKHFKIPFLAITGSNGKTTTKELIHVVLSKKYNTLATIGNLNNHIGVPLTLLRLKKEHEFAIIEMGANHQGEINDLCFIAEPNFGLITNIGQAHLEGFGGIEGVKKGKGELFHYLKNKNGKVFVNGDDEVLKELAIGLEKITYGTKKDNHLNGKDLSQNEKLSFKFSTEKTKVDESELINTHLIGSYNLINCLAAVCVGNYFGVDKRFIKNALEEYHPNMNRSQLFKTNNNTLILDAYNANPNSMKVAIENFSKLQADNKLLLLGDMFELGQFSESEHQKINNLLISNNFENVILVGENFYKINTKHFLKFKTTEEALQYLKTKTFSGFNILIKGSRGMKMERLAEVL